jgi:anti-sigma-K factor RskA
MNDHLEELASLYVLDQLDASERAAFEARLALDPELAALVHDLESTLARRIRALPQRQPPTALLAHIEHRLDQLPATTAADAPAPSPISHLPSPAGFAGLLRWGLAAVIALGVATIAVQNLRHASPAPVVIFVTLDAQRSTATELPLRENPRDTDARFMQLASLAEQFWDKPDRLPIPTAATAGQNRGYALFDPGSKQGFIGIEQLPAIATGQRYHLWMVDTASGVVRDAGVLPLADTNRGLYSFSLATADAAKSGRLNFFITAEENAAPTPSQPRGKVVLGRQRI